MSHVSKLEECHCLIYDPLVRRGVLSLIYLELTSARKSVWILGTSLVVWLLRLFASSAGGQGSIPDQGTRSHVPQLRCGAAKWIFKNAVWILNNHRGDISPVNQLNFSSTSLLSLGFLHVGCLLLQHQPKVPSPLSPPDPAKSVFICSRLSASHMLVVPIFPMRSNIPYQSNLTSYPHSPKQNSFLFAFHSPQANQTALTSSPGIGHLS